MERERGGQTDRRTCIDLLHVKDVTYFRSLCNPQTYIVQTLLEVQHTTWGLKHGVMAFQVVSDGYEDVTVFWDLTRRLVVWDYTPAFQRQLPPSSSVEAVDSSKVSVHIYHTTRRHVPEDYYLYASGFTLCVKFVRRSEVLRAVWFCYLEA